MEDQTSSPKLTNSYRGSISERENLDEIAALENVNNMQIEEELEQLHKEKSIIHQVQDIKTYLVKDPLNKLLKNWQMLKKAI